MKRLLNGLPNHPADIVEHVRAQQGDDAAERAEYALQDMTPEQFKAMLTVLVAAQSGQMGLGDVVQILKSAIGIGTGPEEPHPDSLVSRLKRGHLPKIRMMGTEAERKQGRRDLILFGALFVLLGPCMCIISPILEIAWSVIQQFQHH